jgi:hypothetical protein
MILLSWYSINGTSEETKKEEEKGVNKEEAREGE